MTNKALTILPLLTVLVFTIPVRANQETQSNVKLNTNTDISRTVEIIVIGGLALAFLNQAIKK